MTLAARTAMSQAVAHRGTTALVRRPSIALALGGGGARGLAHVSMLEVFDELGVRPTMIAGTSIGALIGAAYASGLSSREIRAHCEEVLGQRLDLVRQLFQARSAGLSRLSTIFQSVNALLDPVALLELLTPTRYGRDFSQLAIPLKIVATDFYAQEQVVFDSGELRPAVAASIALPALFQPVVHEGRALIDGGLVNPLPFDLLDGSADVVVAVDVTGAPAPSERRPYPSATEALFASAFIFERSIIREKLRAQQPDIYVESEVHNFQITDFLRAKEIWAAAEPAKQRFKAQLERVLAAEPLDPLPAGPPAPRRPRGR